MSAVPTAVDALVAAIDVALPTVQLSDGPPVEFLEPDTIVIGWARDGNSVTVVTSPAGFGSPDREDIDIACLISCTSGDTNIKALRDRAFGFYASIATKIRQDKSLAGTVSSARLAVTGVEQQQGQPGAKADLIFTVSCIALS